jgi:hypothetical protein
MHPFPTSPPNIVGYLDGAPMHLCGDFANSPMSSDSPGRILVPISVTSGQGRAILSAPSHLDTHPVGTPVPQTPLITYKTYWYDQNVYRKVVEDRFFKLETELSRLRSETIYLREYIDKQRSLIAQQFHSN